MDFVSDKLALLMELHQQVVNEKSAREKETGRVGRAPPKTKLTRNPQTGQGVLGIPQVV